MKKYLIISFLFLLIAVPTLAKGPTEAQGPQGQTITNTPENQSNGNQGKVVSTSPTKKPTISPTGN